MCLARLETALVVVLIELVCAIVVGPDMLTGGICAIEIRHQDLVEEATIRIAAARRVTRKRDRKHRG